MMNITGHRVVLTKSKTFWVDRIYNKKTTISHENRLYNTKTDHIRCEYIVQKLTISNKN